MDRVVHITRRWLRQVEAQPPLAADPYTSRQGSSAVSFGCRVGIVAKGVFEDVRHAVAIGIPIVLELTGVLPRTTELVGHAFWSTSGFYNLGNLSELVLIIADVAFIAIATTVFAAAGAQLWSHARIRLADAPETVLADVTITDESGARVAELTGLRLKKLSAEGVKVKFGFL